MELEPHALLRINAHEEIFVPVEVRVEWLSKQAALRMRASAMVGSRISQLDDAIRARALLSIVQEPPASESPAKGSRTLVTASAHGAPSALAGDGKAGRGAPRRGSEGCLAEVGRGHRVRHGSSEPPLDARDLELVARMAVAKIKVVLFQLASPEEKKERLQQGKDVFDVYEGLLTSEDLEQAAKEGFPTLDVDTLLHPKHFRFRSLVAARHRYLLRKLAVLLDMEERGVDSLLDRAADTEKLRDSLADVDLSLDDEAQEGPDAKLSTPSPSLEMDPRQLKDEHARSRSSSSSQSAAASALMSPSGSGAAIAATTAAAAAAASAVAGAVGRSNSLKIASTLRRNSWEKDAGSEDTTEGETDEETMTPQAAHRRDVSDISPSH